jgi:hypothetical protein
MRTYPEGTKLLPPFWWLPNIDVWEQCRSPQTIEDLGNIELVSVYGRPAYRAYFLAERRIQEAKQLDAEQALKATSQAATALLNMLTDKILCSEADQFDTVSADRQPEAVLAVMAIRTSLSVTASSRMASKLTASHMRLCVGLSEERDAVYTFQCAEPCLALAAIRLTHKVDWRVYLNNLRDALGKMYGDAGYRGEIAAQNVLLMAFDRAIAEALFPTSLNPRASMSQISTHAPLIKVIDVLSILLGYTAKIAGTENMYCRVLQFVQFFCKPTTTHLAEMFSRSAAIVCSFNAPATDLIIPVLILNEGEDLRTVKAEPARFTAILVQVNCYADKITKKDVLKYTTTDLTINRCVTGPNSHNYVSLLLELGFKARKKDPLQVVIGDEHLPPAEPGQIPIAIVSLRPSLVLKTGYENAERVDKSFCGLMKASYNPRALSKGRGDQEESLKEMLSAYFEK